MSRQRRLIKNTLILFVGVLGTKIINFIMLPFYTAWLSVEEFGTIDVFTAIISIAVPVLTLQIDQAVFRFMIDSEDDEVRSTVSSGICTLVVSLLTANVILVTLCIIDPRRFNPLYMMAITLQCCYTMTQQIVRGKGLNKVYSANSILLAFTNVSVSIILIRYMKMGVEGYLFAFCISHSIAIIFMIWKTKIGPLITYRQASLQKVKELLHYSLPLILNNVSWWILNASDKLVLNRFCGLNANGIYAAAGKIPGLLTSIYAVFHLAWQESTSREKSSDIAVFYSDIFEKLFALLSFMLILLLCTLRLSFKLINSKFIESYNHIPILLVALFFYCIAQYYGGISVGLKKSKSLGYSSSVAAMINIVINLVFVNHIRIYAASISTIVAFFILMIIRLKNINRTCRITYNYKNISIVLMLICISVFLSYTAPIAISITYLAGVSIVFFFMYREIITELKTALQRRIKGI